MDAVGGQLNAFTSKEYTCYFARTLDSHFDVALDVLTDMFFNSKFDEKEIDKERNVILEEINMYEDTPEDLTVDLLQFQSFQKHPLGLNILGTADTIGSFKRKDFMEFIKMNYRPQNTVIAVAGNIDEQAVLDKISAAFIDFKSDLEPPKESPALYVPGFNLREKDIEQVHLTMGFPGLASGTEESYALAAVNTIFGGGMSSRLFQKIREERGLVYSVYSYNISFWDTGIYLIYAALNAAQVQDVLGLITEEVRGMFTDRITKEQLAKSREQLKSNFLLSLESAANRMNSIGRTLLMLGKVITPDELVEKIDAITMDDFYAVCERIFKMDETGLSLVGRGVEELNTAKLLKA
jgi:predicted Zn-dependent peptidase